MKTTIKQLSDTKLELTITLGAKELEDARKVALSKLAKDIKVPGFRKGKVPLAVAEKNIAPQALQEQLLDDAISKAVAASFIENEIQALDRPAVEVKKFVPSETLEFTAEAEVLPKVTLGDYRNLKSKAESMAVTAKDVEEVIGRIQQGFATKKDVVRAAKLTDETVIDFVGKKDDVAFDGGTATDYPLTLGSNSFIPGFEEAIVGHKPGETFDIDLSFPADYHVADLKGQKVTFTTTLKSIKELELPKVDDEFAAKAGPFTSATEMKADIKKELKAQKEKESREKLKDLLAKELAEVSKVPVPEALIHDQIHSLQRDVQQNLQYQGMTLEQYLESLGMTTDEWHDSKELRDQAISRVKIGLVLAELSKVEKIQATSEELADHIELYRKQYANNPEALKQFEDPEVQRDIANRLLTEKTVERLVELNTK
jgi:trigger factor